MHPKSIAARSCLHCGGEFVPLPQQIRAGTGKFCSHGCAAQSRSRPFADRFWENVRKTEGCWLWTGAKDRSGYGRIGAQNDAFPRAAHRASWQLHFGEIEGDLAVLHRCDQPACVRPDHLFLGTVADNNADARQKGRNAKGETHGRRKLTAPEVRAIRTRYAAGGISMRQLGTEFGIDPAMVCLIVNRKNWNHLD